MKNFLKERLSINKFLLGVFILFALIILGGTVRIAWQANSLSKQDLTVLIPESIASEGKAQLEIFAWDFQDKNNVDTGKVKIILNDKDGKEIQDLFDGNFEGGFINPEITMPKIDPGNYELKILIKTKKGKDEIIKGILITEPAQLFITTDRPLYKPGQMMEYRIMALKTDLTPAADSDIMIEISNPKGDTLYRKKLKTSKYGITSGNFPFAEELAFGDYKITVVYGNYKREKTVNVKQFTLPTYEVKISTEQNLSEKPPIISGRVTARYFFGQPVAFSKVELTLEGGPGQVLHKSNGTTNKEGVFEFKFNPRYRQDNTSLSLRAEVTDSAGKGISQAISGKIAEKGIVIDLIPESGRLRPGLENRILFISSKPDGTPLKTSGYLTGDTLREFETDEYGVAYFAYRPEAANSSFRLNVKDSKGNVINRQFTLENETSSFGYLILRPEKSLIEPGEKIKLEILSTLDQPTRIEVIQAGQTVYSDNVWTKNGRAEKEIDLPDRIFGATEIRAMQVGRRSQSANEIDIISDSKIVIVDRNNNLNVSIASGREKYAPGDEASITFQVRTEAGEPSNSALGVKIIDQALLALEPDESLSRLYFMVSEKVKENVREINGLDFEKVMADDKLASRNIILSAMLQDVPREQVGFTKINKDNRIAWRAHERNKENKIEKLIFLGVATILFFVFKFLWLLSGAMFNQKVFIKIWGQSTVIYIAGIIISGFLFFENNYSYLRFCERIAEATWLYNGYLALPAALLLIVVLMHTHRAWLSAYLPVLKNFVYALTAFFVVLLIQNLLLNGEGFEVTSAIGFYFAFLGSLAVLALFYSKNNELTVASSLGILGMAIILFLSFYYALVFLAILFVVAGIKKVSLESDKEEDIEERIERLREQLRAQGNEEKEIELEIALLTSDIQRQSGLAGRIAVSLVSVFFMGLLTLAFIGLAWEFIGSIDWNDITRASSGIENRIGLGDNDPRVISSNIFRILFGLFGIFFAGLVGISGLKWVVISRTDKKRAKKYLKMFIIGLVGALVILLLFGVANFAIKSVYQATESGIGNRGGGSVGFQSGGGGGGGPDELLWGGFQGELQGSTGLGDSAPSMNFQNMLGDKGSEKVEAKLNETELKIGGTDGYKQAARVRHQFPETMYWQTELIIENGEAMIKVPVKDSITTWKINALANSLKGEIGSGENTFLAYQDFFINFDLPFNLVKDDELNLPVTIYNYLPVEQRIRLSLRDDDWLTVLSQNNQELVIGPNESRTVFFGLRFDKFGDYALRIDAQGTQLADAVEKYVRILPFGQRITQTVASEKLGETGEFQALLPSDVISGTEKITLSVYPSILSQIVSGLEGMLRFPSGCFEQTSSALYPNILVLKYLQTSGQDNQEISQKAENFITAGVQKLLTYELEPGGFSYFGHAPAETVLSAYGLMQFSEMRGVAFIDEDLINRTKNFVYSKQKYDGSFTISGSHRGGFSIADELSKNAYIIWALSEADPTEPKLQKSIKYLESKINELKSSPYSLALAVNIFVNTKTDSQAAKDAMAELKRKIKITGENAMIEMDRPNHYGSYGVYGNIEISALAAIAFSRSNNNDISDKLIDYIISAKDGRGSWGSTQASLLALKALISDSASKKKVDNNTGKIIVTLNDRDSKTLEITPENSVITQSAYFSNGLSGSNFLRLKKEGDIRGTVQLVKDYYQAWSKTAGVSGPLFVSRSISTKENSGIQNFCINQESIFSINLRSNESIVNAVAEIPIPAGFTINTDALDCFTVGKRAGYCPGQASPRISRYENMGDRLILYFDSFSVNAAKAMDIGLQPQYEGSFKLLPIRFYAYYDPTKESFSNDQGTIRVYSADSCPK